MKSFLSLFLVLMAFSNLAQAESACKEKREGKWMPEADFKKKLTDEGYAIKKFKIDDNCYEIYGTNKEGKKVEIYFNPVDASVVKSYIK